MDNACPTPSLPVTRRHAELTDFCDDVLGSMARSDQRRWGHVYVNGLVSVPGRKSISRISGQVVGHQANQCLQQFVNQSPWKWEPVRRRLAQRISSTVPVEAWVFTDVTFPKDGAHSVAVARQFVASEGRTVNCQLAMAGCLTTSSQSFPVTWRLVLPRSWYDDDDGSRRETAAVPTDERHRSRAHHVLDAVDEMIGQWGLRPAPIVTDGRAEAVAEELVQALEDRGLPYAVRVAGDMRMPHRTAVSGRGLRVADLAAAGMRDRAATTVTAGSEGQGRRVVVIPLTGSGDPNPARRVGAHGLGRCLVAEQGTDRHRPATLWLANLRTSQWPEILRLLYLTKREVAGLDEQSGLQHFEGRSYRGWHHHVTLASVAHAFRGLSLHAAPALPDRRHARVAGVGATDLRPADLGATTATG